MKKYLLLFTAFFSISLAYSQAPSSANSSDIYLQMEKLKVLGSVLYIAAHPDDENTRLLAYLAKEKQYRTGYLSLTRGDGGQNLIGDEQGIELGLIRTQELLAARRIDGAEQFFTRAYDFGFSKNAAEALSIWGHDKILSDVVWVIRKFQPDVIITRFPPDERAGHGHHAASAILAIEAFTAAADPTKFPEQFDYHVQPWQAKRILWNTFNFGGTNTTSDTQFKMDVGAFNPLLGKSMGEIAAESRSQHRSQGFGVASQRGTAREYFQLTKGDGLKNSLMDGVITDWKRIPRATDIEQRINTILAEYDFVHPEKSIDALVELYKAIQRMNYRGIWWNKKLAEVQQLIMECAGLFAEATTNSEYAVLGETMNINFVVNMRNNAKIRLEDISLNGFDSSFKMDLPTDQNIGFNQSFTIPHSKEITQPYWLAKQLDGIGSFQVDDQLLIGKAENDPPYSARFVFNVNNINFYVNKPVKYKYTDPVKGERYQPLVAITPLTVAFWPSFIFTNVKPGNNMTEAPTVQLQYKTNFTENNVPVKINLLQDGSVIYAKDTVINCEAGKAFQTFIPVKEYLNKNRDKKLSASILINAQGKRITYTHNLRAIEYDHIPHIHYFYRNETAIISEEIKTAGKNIGYIPGAGDKVPSALQQLGYNVKLLQQSDITTENLKQFDAIITGIRAYNIHDFLGSKYEILMNYIHAGGNLIVQYNTNNNLSNLNAKIGPYPFNISRTRVTDETAPVKFMLPAHPALNYPNKITSKDFEGWIQERSLYQADGLDAHFAAPLAMNDPGESQSNGSLIIAKYGQGNFVYTGLAFFRELPAAVPGAYRLMANLIALPKNK